MNKFVDLAIEMATPKAAQPVFFVNDELDRILYMTQKGRFNFVQKV